MITKKFLQSVFFFLMTDKSFFLISSFVCVCLNLLFLQRVALSFDFPFYGHYLRQITIATGGTF